MNEYYFKVSEADFNETMNCAIELINQGYDQQDSAVKNERSQEVQLYIDKRKMQFFLLDPENIERCEELVKDLYNSEVQETNLNEIELWQKKRKASA